jgi:hypothetical protein
VSPINFARDSGAVLIDGDENFDSPAWQIGHLKRLKTTLLAVHHHTIQSAQGQASFGYMNLIHKLRATTG